VQCSARNQHTVFQQTSQARRLLGDPNAVCQRIGQGAFNVERACRLSAWRHVPSTINVEVEQLHGPYVRLGPLAHVTGLKPSGSSGAPPGQEVPLERWTRVDTGPLFVLGSPRSRSPARHAFLGAPDPLVQGSGVLPRRSGPIDTPWGVLSFLATRCSQPCPCGGVGCYFPCDRGCRTGAASSYCRKGVPLS
jgi:hypothetical protein